MEKSILDYTKLGFGSKVEMRAAFKAMATIGKRDGRRNWMKANPELEAKLKEPDVVRVLVSYNDEYQAILFRVPKCASSSFRTFFPTKAGFKKLRRLKKFMGSKYDSYFKFAFVRNPYDRLVSCWSHQSRPPLPIDAARGTTFLEFVRMIEEDRISKSNNHIIPQVHLVPEGIDFIGKFENLQEDFNTVCDKIGIAQQTLLHKNKSERGHYTEYYNDETREFATRMYERDLETFGYEFGK